MEPEVKVWRAVLVQAINDATLTLPPPKGNREGEKRAAQRQARDWLLNGGKDFRTVCALAGVSSSGVLRYAKQLEEDGWPNVRWPTVETHAADTGRSGIPAQG